MKNSCFCESQSFSLQWAEDISVQCFYNLLHVCLLCLFANILFVFADDFAEFDQVIQLLKSWAAADSTSVQFNKAHSRVVIVRCRLKFSSSLTYDLLHMKDLQWSLYHRFLNEFFSSIKVLHLVAEQMTSLTHFWWLKELLWRELNEMHLIQQNIDCLYSAVHMSHFFHMTVAHTATSLSQSFNFMLFSQWGNEVQSDFEHHLFKFLHLEVKHETSQNSLMIFVTSSLILNMYSLKMHDKILLH